MKKFIIGGSIEALRLSYFTKVEILAIPKKPFYLDRELWREWESLAFVLSTLGLMPASDMILSFRIEQDTQTLKCFTKSSKMLAYEYSELWIVDDDMIEGLPPPREEAIKEYIVCDWISVRRGCTHPYDYIEDKHTNFVERIHFYPSERVPGKRGTRKDACAVSFMTESQLKSNEYSESYSYLKARDMMTLAGIRGTKNGKQAYNGKPAYLSLQIEISNRELFPVHKNLYDDTETLKFNNLLDKCPTFNYNRVATDFMREMNGR